MNAPLRPSEAAAVSASTGDFLLSSQLPQQIFPNGASSAVRVGFFLVHPQEFAAEASPFWTHLLPKGFVNDGFHPQIPVVSYQKRKRKKKAMRIGEHESIGTRTIKHGRNSRAYW